MTEHSLKATEHSLKATEHFLKATEHDLVCRLIQGDEDAFLQLYRRFHPRLIPGLMRLLKDPDLVEEVLQDVFMTLWEKRMDLDPNQNISAFLYTTAVNRCKNMFRRLAYDRKMREYVWKHMQEQRQEGGKNAPDRRLEREDVKRILDSLLDQLTPQQQKVYRLCKLEGYSYQEVGKKLSISETTVNTHIRNANRLLRKELERMSDREFILLYFMFIFL